jgi:uncharacterized membrane protein YhhN
MKNIILTILYFFLGFIFILLQNQSLFLPGFVVKALIIPVLMALFIVNLKLNLNRLNRLVFAGLLFSWAGDVILESSQKNGDLFIAGLLCFLLAHIMYFTAFVITAGKSVITGKRIFLLVPVILYGTGLVYYLYDDLSNMRLPVILYAIVILTMIVGAINRIDKVSRVSYFMVLAGAILFVISDSAIAINKFGHPFESSGIVVMSTYVIAQFLIITGYIRQYNSLKMQSQ